MPQINSMMQQFLSFQPGFREVDGGQLKIMAESLFAAQIGIVAFAGGGQSSATRLIACWNRIDTCASDNDSICLPQAIPGLAVIINNNTAHTVAVFGLPTNPVTGVGDTIAQSGSNTQQPTATGVTQASNIIAEYVCFEAGKWNKW